MPVFGCLFLVWSIHFLVDTAVTLKFITIQPQVSESRDYSLYTVIEEVASKKTHHHYYRLTTDWMDLHCDYLLEFIITHWNFQDTKWNSGINSLNTG